MSIDTARSGLYSSPLCIGLFVVIGVLGGVQSAGFLHFCRLFKKPSHPKKSRLAPKKPSHPKKPLSAFFFQFSYLYMIYEILRDESSFVFSRRPLSSCDCGGVHCCDCGVDCRWSSTAPLDKPFTGKLTNPEHVLTHYLRMNESHPLYLAMSAIHHFYGEANEKKEEELLVKLPFTCDPHGFFDPIDGDDEFLDLGIFPLALMPTNLAAGEPAPSTKFLHLFCEEQKKAKLEQRAQQHSYFRTPSPSKVAAQFDSRITFVVD